MSTAKREKERYATDPEFRARKNRNSLISQKKRKEKVNAYHREYLKNQTTEQRKKRLNTVRHWENRNRDKVRTYRNDWQKEKRRKSRLEIISHYGGRCSCCGESNEVFLAFDHISGGGVQHVKSLKNQNLTLVKWIIKNNFPDSIQLLCHNCNYAKHREGVCPHKK